MSDLKADIRKAVRLVAKDWQKQKLKKERLDKQALREMRTEKPARITFKDAAYYVMEEAYMRASGDGKYHALARQMMYAARRRILEITGRRKWKKKDDQYFHTLLKDYLDEYEPPWKVIWDSRGHIWEPHTGIKVGLGGLEINEYSKGWLSAGVYMPSAMSMSSRIKTSGPRLRFSTALFIEKEGFMEALGLAGLPERYDLALFSSKGIPNAATCHIANRLHKKGVRILVVRDFDKDGFKIAKTLRKGARRAPGTPIIDLGFRLKDIKGLLAEPVVYSQKDKDPREYLEWECDATPEECEFLVDEVDSYYQKGRWRWKYSGQRVELNAMTMPQFIEWLENKLEELGIEKVIPCEDDLKKAYHRALALQEINEATKTILGEHRKKEIEVPPGLKERVTEKLAEDSQITWDDAIWSLAEEDEDNDAE